MCCQPPSCVVMLQLSNDSSVEHFTRRLLGSLQNGVRRDPRLDYHYCTVLDGLKVDVAEVARSFKLAMARVQTSPRVESSGREFVKSERMLVSWMNDSRNLSENTAHVGTSARTRNWPVKAARMQHPPHPSSVPNRLEESSHRNWRHANWRRFPVKSVRHITLTSSQNEQPAAHRVQCH